MRHRATRAFAPLLVISLLILPAVLDAKEKHGAEVVVTRLDGSRAAGELIAVKPDSLLLLSVAGQDETVGIADIQTVRIVRKSRAMKFALIGLVTGAAEALYVTTRDEEDRTTGTTIGWMAGLGAAQALLGFAIGAGVGADAILPFEGESDEAVATHLRDLKGYSREVRRGGAVAPAEIRSEAAPPGASAPVPPKPSRRPRFRFSLGTAADIGVTGYSRVVKDGSWRFPGDVPPAEAGPYPLSFIYNPNVGSDDAALFFGPISLAYEWTDRWLTEIEWFHQGGLGAELYVDQNLLGNEYGQATFVSTSDLKTYGTAVPPGRWPNQRVDIDALLIGLDYRLLAPSPLKRAAIEVGAAAGPAWVRIVPNEGILPADRKVTPSVRVHGAFDYYFVRSFSLGLMVSYRYVHAEFPAGTASGDAAFYDVDDIFPYETEPIVRLTEVSYPVRTATRGSISVGVRIAFRL
jgi:hypothetical protein